MLTAAVCAVARRRRGARPRAALPRPLAAEEGAAAGAEGGGLGESTAHAGEQHASGLVIAAASALRLIGMQWLFNVVFLKHTASSAGFLACLPCCVLMSLPHNSHDCEVMTAIMHDRASASHEPIGPHCLRRLAVLRAG